MLSYDDYRDYEELRTINIGFSVTGILFVVAVERELEDGEEITRLISARKADKFEIQKWENNNGSK